MCKDTHSLSLSLSVVVMSPLGGSKTGNFGRYHPHVGSLCCVCDEFIRCESSSTQMRTGDLGLTICQTLSGLLLSNHIFSLSLSLHLNLISMSSQTHLDLLCLYLAHSLNLFSALDRLDPLGNTFCDEVKLHWCLSFVEEMPLEQEVDDDHFLPADEADMRKDSHLKGFRSPTLCERDDRERWNRDDREMKSSTWVCVVFWHIKQFIFHT